MSTKSTVVVEWNGQQHEFTAPDEVTIGRDRASTIVLGHPSVSRHHAALRHDGQSWVLHDLSSRGTYVDGAPQRHHRLCAPTTVVFGDPAGDQRVRLLPAPEAEPTTAAPGKRPGGELVVEPHDADTVLPGSSIHLALAAQSVTLAPGQSAVIGRDRACDLVSVRPSVSRRHARVTFASGQWRYEDLGSTGGSHVDGERVGTVVLDGATTLTIGDAATGERLVATVGTPPLGPPPSGPMPGGGSAPLAQPAPMPGPAPMPEPVPPIATRATGPAATRRPARTLATVAGCLVALLAATFGVLRLTASSSGADAAALARATVKIIVPDGWGSGSIIDAQQGLILTNAHVVDEAIDGARPTRTLSPEPASLVIAVADGLERSAEPMFRAEVVVVDEYLDLAVIRITTTLSGAVAEPQDLARLQAVEIGDSDDVKTGDEIQVLGYPGVADSEAATITRGPIEGVVADPNLGTNRAFLNIQAPVEPGNSGGMAVDSHGRLVGVPTLNRVIVQGGDSHPVQSKVGSMRPINLAHDLITAAETGAPYESPYVETAS